MSDLAIRVEGLGKRYRIGQRGSYKALRDVLAQAPLAPYRWLRSKFGSRNGKYQDDGYIWALRDVSFEVIQGEVIGIIGRNGAGKSTLLKILSRITKPTKGYAEIYGRVGSLLEVGTGFHPELTGRENIYLNGAILGMNRNEIKRQFDKIVDFAEIEQFLDTPVKRYSSGMYVRLAFAVAAHLEPEILLVDEVLSVGDAEFQKKCLGKMNDVSKEGRTILFVSHNMSAINRLCNKAILIDNGKLCFSGVAEDVIARYLVSRANASGKISWKNGAANVGVGEFKVFEVSISDSEGKIVSSLSVCKSFSIKIKFRILHPLPSCRVGFWLSTVDGIIVLETYDSDIEKYSGPRRKGEYIMTCEVPANLLNPGRYLVSINAGIPNIRNLAFLEGVLRLNIEDTGAVGSQLLSKRRGVVRPKLNWTCETV
jgi:lipopolysaccharide transport system ATP-binding protein